MASRSVIVSATLLIASLLVPDRTARAAYRQGAFLIGGMVTDMPVPADTTILSRIAAAGIDWVFYYGWNYSRRAGAADVTAKLEQLRAHHAGFAMKALSCYEIEPDEKRTGRGRLFLNREDPLSRAAIDSMLSPARGINGPSTLGWTIWDEPEPGDSLAFRNIGLISRWIAANPGSSDKLAFTNLFSSSIRGTAVPDEEYTAYLERYLGLFDSAADPPPVLSFDEYPFQVPERIETNWFRTLRLVRDAANAHGRAGRPVPWWAMIQLSPFHYPGESRFSPMFSVVNTRWQAYTAVAYGAKGLCYFQLGPAQSRKEVFGDGILDQRGDTVAATYSQIRALNSDLHHLGPTLMRLDPVTTFHPDTLCWTGIKDELLPGARNGHAIVASFNAGSDSTLAGHLRDRTNGDDYLMVVSKALVANRSFTLTLANRADSLFRVDRSTGRQVLLGTATNTIRLRRQPPGQGELFHIRSAAPPAPPRAGAAPSRRRPE